jgi:hypothetical protein
MDYREGEKDINDLTACRGNRSPDFDAPVDLGFELVVALVKIVFRDVAWADIGACNVLKMRSAKISPRRAIGILMV